MSFDRKEASKTIHLTHVPKDGEREESLSHCHVCLKKKPLTEEHIPPKKAFNNCNRLWDRMILAVEQLSYAKHVPDLRKFVLNKKDKIVPPFKIYAFLVPDIEQSGTVLRFHARVDTYAPGYEFVGGEISWYPFGFVYASKIGKGYDIEKLIDITNWFSDDFSKSQRSLILKLYRRITGVDSIQSLLSGHRVRPQIGYISERYI